jgi:hypothetical protein
MSLFDHDNDRECASSNATMVMRTIESTHEDDRGRARRSTATKLRECNNQQVQSRRLSRPQANTSIASKKLARLQ